MDPDTFTAELTDRGLDTQRAAAAALGVGQGTISKWRSGVNPIPPVVALALKAIPRRRTAQGSPKTKNGRIRKASTIKG